MWQDLIITLANILFIYALLPQLYLGFKEKKGVMTYQTSIVTTIGLYATCIAFTSLNLLFSGIITGITGTIWFMFLVQRIIYK